MDLLVSQIKRNTDDDDEDQLNSKHLLVFEDNGEHRYAYRSECESQMLHLTRFARTDSLNGSDLDDGLSDDEQFEEESEAEDSGDMDVDDDEDDN